MNDLHAAINEADERKVFEAEITGMPYERSVRRYPNTPDYAWPGNYVEMDIDLAWNIWRARAAQAAPVVPPGFVLVPIEPTPEMVIAGWIDTEDVNPGDIWAAMCAAAPSAKDTTT